MLGTTALLMLITLRTPQAQPLNADRAALSRITVSLPSGPSSFNELLGLLSKRIGMTIVVDDEPVKLTADGGAEGTATEVMDRVARAFDYSWTIGRSGCVLMYKRFDSESERPQVTNGEAKLAASSIIRCLRTLPVRPDTVAWIRELRELHSTLTPEQVQLASSGGLAVSSLAPLQQQRVEAAVIHQSFGAPFNVCEALIRQLDIIDTWSTEPALPITQIPAPPPLSSPTPQVRLVWMQGNQRRGRYLPHYRGQDLIRPTGGSAALPLASLSEIDGLSATSLRAMEQTCSMATGSRTLSSLCAEISTATDLKIEAEAVLSEHRVALYTAPAKVGKIVEAICELCNWRVGQPSSSVCRIVPAKVSLPRSWQGIYPAIRDALPVAWRRYLCHIPEGSRRDDPQAESLRRLGMYDAAIGMPAQRNRIRTVVAELSQKIWTACADMRAKDGRLKYSDMTADEREVLLSAVVLDSLLQLCEGGSAPAIFLDKPTPFEQNASRAIIKIEGGGIGVHSIETIGDNRLERGFGGPLQEASRIPRPGGRVP